MLNLEIVELLGADGVPFGDISYYPDSRSFNERRVNTPARETFVFTHYPSVIDPDYVPMEIPERVVNLVFQALRMSEPMGGDPTP